MPHRAFAASRAIFVLCFFVRASRRALPPFAAPSLLNATAAGLRVSGGGVSCPVVIRTILAAIWLKSGRDEPGGPPVCFLILVLGLLAREGMAHDTMPSA